MRTLRRWTCKAYYLGIVYVYMPMEASEAVVISHFNKKLCHNWDLASLTRGDLVKDTGQAGLLGKVKGF